MNKIKYLIVCLVCLCFHSHMKAQLDTTYAPLDTGFLFIDGQYVERPYVFTIKNNTLYINDYQASTDLTSLLEKPKKKNFVPYLPLDIPEHINKNSTLSEINALEDKNGNKFTVLAMRYYIEKYSTEIAMDSMMNYYRTYLKVTNITKRSKEMFCITKHDRTLCIDFSNSGRISNLVHRQQDVNDKLKSLIELITFRLEDESCCFIETKGVHLNKTYEETLNILKQSNNKAFIHPKTKKNVSYGIGERAVITNYKSNEKLEKKLEQLISNQEP